MTSALRVALAALMLAGSVSAQPVSAGPDPIEGKWLGITGFPQDRVAIGFEFRQEEGGIRAYWYAPVTNFYAIPLDGFVEREGEASYRLASVLLSVELQGDSLVGTYYPLRAPITMHRTDVLPSETPLPDFPPSPDPIWRTKLGGSIYAPAAVHGGVSYVGTTAGFMFAVDIETGTPLWSFRAGRPIHGEALVTDDAVFFVCDNGYLFRLDRETGDERWRYDLGDARTDRILGHALETSFDIDVAAPQPLLLNGQIHVGAGDGSFHAVDAEHGQRVWRIETEGRIRTSALVVDSTLVFGGFDGVLHGVDPATGEERWRRPVPGEITSTPALVAGRLIIGSRGGLLVALDPDTRAPAWRTLFWGSSVESHPVEGDGLLYIGSSNLRRVAAYDPADGRVLWRTDVHGFAWGRPLVTDRLIIAAVAGISPHPIRHLGSLTALDRQTGSIAWRWAGPACEGCMMDGFVAGAARAGERVIIGGLDGSLYAFPLRAQR